MTFESMFFSYFHIIYSNNTGEFNFNCMLRIEKEGESLKNSHKVIGLRNKPKHH